MLGRTAGDGLGGGGGGRGLGVDRLEQPSVHTLNGTKKQEKKSLVKHQLH